MIFAGIEALPLATDEPEFTIPELKPAQAWTYTWKTSGLLSLLFPDSGDGRLIVEEPSGGLFRAELRVDAAEDVHWLTGSLIEADTLTVRETWTSYQWHGRVRTRHRTVDRDGVVDMLATVLRLRRDLPDGDLPLDFQAGSSVYPIVASRQPEGLVYQLRDRATAGERWNKSAEVTFTNPTERRPQHIALIERLIRIDLELVEGE